MKRYGHSVSSRSVTYSWNFLIALSDFSGVKWTVNTWSRSSVEGAWKVKMGTVLMADLSGPFLILSKLLNEKKVKGFPVVFHSDFYIVRPAAFYHGSWFYSFSCCNLAILKKLTQNTCKPRVSVKPVLWIGKFCSYFDYLVGQRFLTSLVPVTRCIWWPWKGKVWNQAEASLPCYQYSRQKIELPQ